MSEYLVDWQSLLEQAKHARTRAYAPYSKFAVGAALLTSTGEVFIGCNVENASLGATNCAELTALFSAVASIDRANMNHQSSLFRALVVVADSQSLITPCGLCRQVLAEFCASDMPVMLADLRGNRQIVQFAQLLPFAFSRTNLLESEKSND
jgi:cytidine deaminase